VRKVRGEQNYWIGLEFIKGQIFLKQSILDERTREREKKIAKEE